MHYPEFIVVSVGGHDMLSQTLPKHLYKIVLKRFKCQLLVSQITKSGGSTISTAFGCTGEGNRQKA